MSNNIIDLLLNKIKEGTITWLSLDFLKKQLKKEGKSLRDIQVLGFYTIYLQKDKFLFDCSETYLSILDESLYVFSKNLSSFDFRLDVVDLHSGDIKWQQIEAPMSLLLRLKNAITITISDSIEEYSNFLLLS